MSDSLGRFVDAQAPIYPRVLDELRAGRKRSHWMWFVFPQLAGLGRSPTSQYYAIASAEEGKAYLAHPLLGARLIESTQAVLAHAGTSAPEIFGEIDALKFASSMTLFEAVAADPSPFVAAVETFFASRRDPATLAMLAK